MAPTEDTRAARALLAYFNHTMATRLVRRVLKEKSPEAAKRLADAILDLVPKASADKLWSEVLTFVQKKGGEYINGTGFAAKVQKRIEQDAERFLQDAIVHVLQAQVREVIVRHMKSYDGAAFLKTIPGKFQTLVDIEIQKAAQQAASARI